MSIEIIDILKPKNGLSFKLIEDIDIAVSGYTSLADAVAHFATKEGVISAINTALSGKQDTLTTPQLTAVNSGITSALVTQIGTNTTAIAGKADAADLTALAAVVDTKADDSDLTTATNNLQGQINQIVISSSAESIVAPEVASARVGVDGIEYNTLKNRLDAADNITKDNISDIHTSLGYVENSFDVPSGQLHYTSENQLYYPIKNGKSYTLTIKTDPNRAFSIQASVFEAGSTTAISIGYVTTNTPYVFTAQTNANRIGLYITSQAVNIHYNVCIEESNSLLTKLKNVESYEEKQDNNIDNIIYSLGYAETSFDVPSGQSHYSSSDQLYYPFKENEAYTISVKTNASNAYTMILNLFLTNSNTPTNIGTITSDSDIVFTAPSNADRIGAYIQETTENINCVISIQANNSISNQINQLDSELQLQATDMYAFEKTGETAPIIASSSSLDKRHYITGTVGSVYTVSGDNHESVYTESPIDVSDAVGGKIRIQVKALNSGGTRNFGFCNSSKVVSAIWKEQNTSIFSYNSESGYYEANLPVTDTHFFFSYNQDVAMSISIRKVEKVMYTKSDVDAALVALSDKPIYISENGSDSNIGSSTAPLATVNKALELGASNILIYGGTYRQTIDLSKAAGTKIVLSPCSFDKSVIFTDPSRIIAESATSESGYTHVKSVALLTSPSENNRWIWQEGIEDEKTLITDAKRHPLQRGMEYRATDTRIIKTTSSTLAEALAEIENDASSGTYKWFYDNGTLYFASPEIVSNINPICYSRGNRLFENTPNNFEIEANGIETKYLCFNVSNTIKSTIRDCKATNVYAPGAYVYDNCLSVSFIRCEAANCVYGVNGDGFNGHSNLNYAPFAKQCTCILEDCWSHDNNDDGYSDHERAETSIIGGLFEANKKGGITPSYGSHCTCYNVMSRDNFSGFLCTGSVEVQEGGIGTQMICYNCVAINNQGGGMQAGFCVDSGGNKMILIDCKSIGNVYGYIAQSATDIAELTDCGSNGNTYIKGGVGTFTVTNTSLVTN